MVEDGGQNDSDLNQPAQVIHRAAVIGAGMAGLTAANLLQRCGVQTTIFEKGRGVGGRMSSRRGEGFRIDHGAQYFTLRDERFASTVERWLNDGTVAAWNGPIAVIRDGSIELDEKPVVRYVGVPGMCAPLKRLATSLDVQLSTQIISLDRSQTTWSLRDRSGACHEGFDVVIVAIPAPQAAILLAQAAPQLASVASTIDMQPCWAVMMQNAHGLAAPFGGAFVHHSPLSWIMNGATRPGRPADAGWILHADAKWSQRHLESSPDEVIPRLLQAFEEATHLQIPHDVELTAHPWRYAISDSSVTDGCLWDPELHLGICGDWCAGARVEGAFLSGYRLAGRVLGAELNAVL